MKYLQTPISQDELLEIKKQFGRSTKITVDIVKEDLVVGCLLHADAVPLLIEKGSLEENIWGGWIHFESKQVTSTAVLNIRPKLNNLSMEILDNARRDSFYKVVNKLFSVLWS